MDISINCNSKNFRTNNIIEIYNKYMNSEGINRDIFKDVLLNILIETSKEEFECSYASFINIKLKILLNMYKNNDINLLDLNEIELNKIEINRLFQINLIYKILPSNNIYKLIKILLKSKSYEMIEYLIENSTNYRFNKLFLFIQYILLIKYLSDDENYSFVLTPLFEKHLKKIYQLIYSETNTIDNTDFESCILSTIYSSNYIHDKNLISEEELKNLKEFLDQNL